MLARSQFTRPTWLLTLFGASGLCLCWSIAFPAARAVADPPTRQAATTNYDADPDHLWNRLHVALLGLTKTAETSDPWEVDPFLRRSDEFAFEGTAYKNALMVLDEFIAKHGETSIVDPRKRAVLQRDLWALFESPSPPRQRIIHNPQMAVATRLARIIPRLSLSADEIRKLPDNYAEAVAAKTYLLPAKLWDPAGPWVLLGDDGPLPLAITHTHFFGGRSTFFVFMRMPEGRDQTLKFLTDLKALAPAADPPMLPQGTQLALVRQLQVIDQWGRPVTTKVCETIQLRGGGLETEWKLDRQAFLAGMPSLKAVGDDGKERDFLMFMGNNIGQGPSKILGTCIHCHQGRTINAVLSYGRFQPVPQTPTKKPTLIAAKREEVEMTNRAWKANRYEWGLLQGMIQGRGQN